MYISKLRHLLSAAGNFHLNCGANACATNAFSFNDPDAWNSLRPRDFSERNWGKRRSGPAVWNSQKAAKNCLTPAIKCIYMLCKSTPPAKFGNPGCGQGVLLREDNPGRAFGIMENRQAISDVAKCREIGRRCACHNLRRATRAITRLYDDFPEAKRAEDESVFNAYSRQIARTCLPDETGGVDRNRADDTHTQPGCPSEEGPYSHRTGKRPPGASRHHYPTRRRSADGGDSLVGRGTGAC